MHAGYDHRHTNTMQTPAHTHAHTQVSVSFLSLNPETFEPISSAGAEKTLTVYSVICAFLSPSLPSVGVDSFSLPSHKRKQRARVCESENVYYTPPCRDS